MKEAWEFVLYYNPDSVGRAKSLEVFSALGIRARLVEGTETTQTIGYLAGLPGQEPRPSPLAPLKLEEPMMILAGFSRERMDYLFAALHKAGTPPANRKAVLTPTNAGWAFYVLYEELGQEHAVMHGEKKGS